MDLDAIRQRSDNATPAPWPVDYVADAVRHIARNCEDIVSYTDPAFEWDRYDDAEFIAHARADVPWLLAELVRVQSENTQLREENEKLKGK